MTKKDLVKRVSEELGMSAYATENVIDMAFEKISTALQNGEKVTIKDFGCFEPKQRAERGFYNMQTGEHDVAPAKKTVTFRPYTTLANTL